MARSCFAKVQTPSSLIQLRCVGVEALQAQTPVLAEELIQWRAFMGWGIVQKHDHRTRQVSQQMAEEDAYLLLTDMVEPELVREAEMLALRT